jgi:hypothetical protein
MKKTYLFKSCVLTACIALLTIGCAKENSDSIDDLKTAGADNAQSSSISDDVVSTVDGFVNKAETTIQFVGSDPSKVSAQVDTTAVNVTVVNDKTSITGYPKTVTIDFGTDGYTGKRGNVYKGKVIVTVSGLMLTPGSVRTIKYQNLSVNDNAVAGSKTVTCKTPLSWEVVAKDTITRASDGAKIIYNSNHTRTYVPSNTESYFVITGTANGVNAKGKSYTAEITTLLKIYVGYKHIVSGILTVKSGSKTAIIDYGDGTKDDKAKVTIGIKTYDITLAK